MKIWIAFISHSRRKKEEGRRKKEDRSCNRLHGESAIKNFLTVFARLREQQSAARSLMTDDQQSLNFF
ncbi:hypothetical protein IQ269_12305 [Tychonema sp. LEGE 07199]|uniref:hypothetical protein n=1 Tax=unclassified Tychonema TaxID=2642144 RepID=UPI00187FF148|nr:MULTISPECIES: hypothetical protein [unclassified Tychonema]MBE9121560.1 hypothetical protein [Tychonema sp. LEGE 07199]MBE9132664.1 hypothetical protein [Tychonema sp. LEGE 07196]